MLRKSIILIVVINLLYPLSNNDFIQELNSIFNKKQILQISRYIDNTNKIPYDYLVLKIKEGIKKKVDKNILFSVTIKILKYYNQYTNNKISIKNDNYIYSYLIDFAVNNIDIIKLKNILHVLYNSNEYTNEEIYDILDKILYVISFDIDEKNINLFLINLYENPYKFKMLRYIDYYITLSEIKKIDINQAIKIFIKFKKYYSKKQILNKLKDYN